MTRETLAIIGTGIAGMGCAHFLADQYDVHLFEKNAKPGGHTNTLTVTGDAGQDIPIDTGFMVFNKETYPNLCRLFKQLNTPIMKTDMSFSVSTPFTTDTSPTARRLEWNGAGVNKVFGQRRNVFSPRFYRFVKELTRFNAEATRGATSGEFDTLNVRDYLTQQGYSEDFNAFYLTPMSGAIWSTAPSRILDFPVQTLMRFFHNHGFLGLDTHHQWYTVQGGTQVYAKTLLTPFQDRLHLGHQATHLKRHPDGVDVSFLVTGPNGDITSSTQRFDKVILAGHADDSWALLGDPSVLEADLLPQFQYQYNYTQLHTDASVMPKTRRCWASWNYRIDAHEDPDRRATTHYWMSNLQHLPGPTQYFVSLNAEHQVRPEAVLKTIEYYHPIYTLAALKAQKRLPELNKQAPHQRVFFAGSYFRYGFHEDALLSAVTLCEQLLGRSVWP